MVPITRHYILYGESINQIQYMCLLVSLSVCLSVCVSGDSCPALLVDKIPDERMNRSVTHFESGDFLIMTGLCFRSCVSSRSILLSPQYLNSNHNRLKLCTTTGLIEL